MENKYSRQSFHKLLRSPSERSVFNSFLNSLLEKDPYFTPAYLELLWEADEKKNKTALQNLLRKTIFELNSLYVEFNFREKVLENWSSLELESLKVILLLALKKGNFSFFERIVIKKQFSSVDKFFNIKTVVSPKDSKKLKLINFFYVNEVKDELKGVNFQHKKLLFSREKVTSFKYKSKHKDFLVDRIKEFPRTSNLIFRLADELKLNLVKIRIVTIEPFKHKYSPRISSEKLKRYCLVVESKGACVFESGDEKKFVKEGDLWFIDRNTRQLNYNISEVPLVYIVFDGYFRSMELINV